MNYKNQKSIGEVIKEFINQYQLSDKFLELEVKKVWHEKFGKAISNRTDKLIFKKGVLIVYINSSVLKEELVIAREAIAAKLNQDLGKVVVTQVQIR